MDRSATATSDSLRHGGQSAWVAPGHSLGSVTDKISGIVLDRPTSWGWIAGFAASFGMLMLLLVSIGYLLVAGIGIWGVNVPVAWAFAIVNFVWWIGIGHAGTLISAILLLLHQHWRTSISRFAEAMTLFAISCAGLFPLLHLGRPGYFYWMLPYPNTLNVWPQFRSPLVWDLFAILTYFLVSLLFWYLGLIPDVATLRDRSSNRAARAVWSVLAMGWRGEVGHWHHYETAMRLLAGLATPLVVSVHSIVAYDFSVALVPGWHTTVFPPYFVAGAMFSGFAMVLVLAIPLRTVYGLKDFITVRHLNVMAMLMLATGLMVAYGYAMEWFGAWYSGSVFERSTHHDRLSGAYAPVYWTLLACNVLIPQVLWSRRVRQQPLVLFGVALVVLVGMWLERFIIVVGSLYHDHLPPMWGQFSPTFWDWATLVGSLGLFLTLLFLFLRVLPMVSMFEMRKLVWHAKGSEFRVQGSGHSNRLDREAGV